ncbi:HPr-rel-A system PqqD family peptide chaperone [Sphingomonas sp. LY54]|uniref:HPr-rel-A system PqqD family peptide chaperone n=1 Tax=Sphingomonas sp. LY54 TaxID=3095343 RepID=UPI002D764BC3|nr:HPr-rel-A system PqqD family peptide chaperone [Sphingomonas sp. LY54]WRP29342.1 HPr-rel-A system PqqD family peptide chaperone [Sphingomonas sp. LY54]
MAGPHYIADRADDVRLIELDGLTALYHRPSGTTHILAAPAPQILAAIADDPATADEILARMAAGFDVDGDRDALLPRLDELEAAGLIHRSSPAQAGAQAEGAAGPRLSPGSKRAA